MYRPVLTLSANMVKGDRALVLVYLQLSGRFKLFVYLCWLSIGIIIVVIVNNATVALPKYLVLELLQCHGREVVNRRLQIRYFYFYIALQICAML